MSCGGASGFVKGIAEHVVGDIGHADPNGPDEELHLVLLPGEDMLDGRPDL